MINQEMLLLSSIKYFIIILIFKEVIHSMLLSSIEYFIINVQRSCT